MDSPLIYYPIQDFGPAMKGMVIGGLGVFHVFLAQMAIGGGMLLCYFEVLRQKGLSRYAGLFVDGYFRMLILLSFILGALTGVGMWFTSIQISPRTIGMMVEEFHWFWAIEWTFFCLEVVSGYMFIRYGDRIADRGRLTLLALYSVAAWASLFWINGILSWQLTPGEWLSTGRVWDGFLNPSFWPSLVYRTLASMAIAALAACVVVNVTPGLDREARRELIGKASHFLAVMVFMPVVGLWFLMTIPEDSRGWAMGGSVIMTGFLALSVSSSLLVGLYALVGLLLRRVYINGFTAALLCALAFAATAGGESVREGVRKPYTIRQVLYSNSLTQRDVERLREEGSVGRDPYPVRGSYPGAQVELGARVFRFQCSICHTLEGANGILHLLGTWTREQKRMNIAQLQRTKPFMPPFAGNAQELEALVQYLEWSLSDRPDEWPSSSDEATRNRIQAWLDEVGTEPAIQRFRREGATE